MRLLKVGRDMSCDIVLRSDRVNPLHAEITVLDNGDILLEDKNSATGTYIMNQPIKPGTSVNIKRGDAVRFGDVELQWSQVPQADDNSKYRAVYGIGTNYRNEIQVKGNTVSRFHATLKIDKSGKAYLQDHSKNGTTINGKHIGSNQLTPVKKGDSVVCAGVPVALDSYIPSSSMGRIAIIAASILIAVVASMGLWKFLGTQSMVSPKDMPAMENATVCVYGGYYFKITINDDPFKKLISEWPNCWYVGYDQKGNLKANLSTSDLTPLPYMGTAFFISEDGELGTNRHVALPWEYREEKEEVIRQMMQVVRNEFSSQITNILIKNIEEGNISADNATAWRDRFIKSDITIDGIHAYLGIGLMGSKVNNLNDLLQCQIIADSGDPHKDVALIRLNSRKTPDYIIKMGAIYDIENARTDERSLVPLEETLTIVGYPLGEGVSNEMFDGKELRPTGYEAKLSKSPDEYQMQIQAMSLGGQSGSPVVDKKHRLVGVLCSGFTNTQVTYCCNIKHLKELYDKNKVRK